MKKVTNLLKRIISSITSVVTAATLLVGVSLDQTAMKADALNDLNSWEITNQMTIGWNLGNSLDCSASWLNMNSNSPKEFAMAWGNPEPTYDLINKVKDCGFNTIRIPVTWYQHLYNDGSSYVIQQEWLDYVKKVVDYAYDMDMFVIMNIHHEEGWINVDKFTDDTLSQAKDKMEDVWKQLAETFKSYDQHLIFEGMNEPRQLNNPNVAEWGDGNEDGGYTYSYLNQLNELFIRTVRANGSKQNKERLLMIPSYHATASKSALMQLNIPENSGNVAISVHAYEPYFFTMDTSSSKDWPGYTTWGSSYQSLLQSTMDNLKDVSTSKNAPIIIGEFSASDFGNTNARVNWAKEYISMAKARGLVCVLWDNNSPYNGETSGEKHGYINRSDNSIYPNAQPVLNAMMETIGAEISDIPTDDFWNNVSIGDNWIQIKRFDNGKSLAEWAGEKVTTDLSYINKNYKIAVVYDGTTPPRAVLEKSSDYSWDVSVDGTNSEKYISYYNYSDFATSLANNNVNINDMGNLIIQALPEAKLYGVYAVPVNDDSSDIESSSETSSEEESSSDIESSSEEESSSETENTGDTWTGNENITNDSPLVLDVNLGDWEDLTVKLNFTTGQYYGGLQIDGANSSNLNNKTSYLPWTTVTGQTSYEYEFKASQLTSDINKLIIGGDQINVTKVEFVGTKKGGAVHTHKYTSKVTKAATCTTDGVRTYTCSCGDSYTEVIKATGHKFGAWTTTTAATCTEDGVQTRTCSVCGEKETKAIAATGHKYVETVVAPTTTEQGYTLHKCSVCGDEYKDNFTDPVKEQTTLGGKVGSQRNSKGALRFIAMISTTDAAGADIAYYDLKVDGKLVERVNVTKTYKSFLQNGKTSTAPAGNNYIISSTLSNLKSGQVATFELYFSNFDLPLTKTYTVS